MPFWNRSVWEGSPVRPALSEVYARVAPELETSGSNHRGAVADDANAEWVAAIAAVPGFTDPEIRTYDYELAYTTDAYAQLLETFSAVRLMDAARRERLTDGVRAVIDDRGGTLTVPMRTIACLARGS